MKGSHVKIYFLKTPSSCRFKEYILGKEKIKKEEHKHKYSVRQHYVIISCLAAFNMADLSNKPCSFR